MPEIGTSGLMSGAGKRGGDNVSTRAHPRLYLRFRTFMAVPPCSLVDLTRNFLTAAHFTHWVRSLSLSTR